MGLEVKMEAERQEATRALRRTARLSVELVYEATLLAEASGLSEEEIETAIGLGTIEAGTEGSVLVSEGHA